MVLSMALVGVTAPAVWISSHLLAGVWAVPILWAFVIGGPLLGVIAGLMFDLSAGSGRSFGRLFGMGSWVVLILSLVGTLPFPWILVFE
jgi:hypothetical protein